MGSEKREALDFKRGSGYFAAFPEDIYLPGIDGDDDHYLKRIDKRRLVIDEGLVQNLMANGAIQSAVVAKEGDRVVAIAGLRRILHLRIANQRLVKEGKAKLRIDVKYRRGTQKELFGVFLSENEFRKDLSVLYKARHAERMRNLGATEDEIAIQFGVTKQTLSNWNKLIELDPRVIAFVESGQLNEYSAILLHGLPLDEQFEKAKQAITEGVQTGKKPTSKTISRTVSPDKIRAPSMKLVQKVVEAKHEHISNDFLLGLQYGRGLLSARQAGVAEVIDELTVPPPPKLPKPVKRAAAKKRGVQ